MQVGNVIPIIVLILLASSVLLMLGSIRRPTVDVVTAAASFYTIFTFLVVEGIALGVPEKIRKPLADASVLAFLPAFLMFFYAGYRYGSSLRVAEVLVTVFASVGIGVIMAVIAFIVLSTIGRTRG